MGERVVWIAGHVALLALLLVMDFLIDRRPLFPKRFARGREMRSHRERQATRLPLSPFSLSLSLPPC